MEQQESPAYLKMSTAAALTLGFKTGRFYRNARLYCINLLEFSAQGCTANCAYCGLADKKETEKIRLKLDTPISVLISPTITREADLGGETHLFSFYPEPGSQMATHPPRRLANIGTSSWPDI